MKFVTTVAEAGRKQISEANYISLSLILSVLVGLILKQHAPPVIGVSYRVTPTQIRFAISFCFKITQILCLQKMEKPGTNGSDRKGMIFCRIVFIGIAYLIKSWTNISVWNGTMPDNVPLSTFCSAGKSTLMPFQQSEPQARALWNMAPEPVLFREKWSVTKWRVMHCITDLLSTNERPVFHSNPETSALTDDVSVWGKPK